MLQAFESKLAAQLGDVEQLRDEVVVIDRRVDQLDAKIPAIVQSTLDVRFGDVQHKLHQDFEEARSRSMAAFVETLQSRMVEIPAIVQSTVDVRFRDVQQKLQQDFDEAQSRSMAAFVDTLQTRVVNRINTLETNLADQSDAIGKLRDTSLRTDENLQKMLVGIERLVDQSRVPQAEAPPPPAPQAPAPEPVRESAVVVRIEEADEPEKIAAHLTQVRDGAVQQLAESQRVPEPQPVLVSQKPVTLEAAPPPVPATAPVLAEAHAAELAAPPGESPQSEESYEWVNRIGLELLAPQPKPYRGWRIPLAVGLVAGLILIAGLLYSGILQRFLSSSALRQTSTLASTSPEPDSSASLNAGGAAAAQQSAYPDTNAVSLVEQGRDYSRRKDWVKAESAFRSALEASPGDRDAALGLSDVLYQEQKYEESAAVLNKLSSASKP